MGVKYKQFKMEKEVKQWVQEYSGYFPKLTDSDTDFLMALYFYTASENVPINRHLREDNTLLEVGDMAYYDLKSMLQKLPFYHIPDNVTVYRYINRGLLKQMCPNWPPHKGMIISDKGFMSTTLLRHGVDQYLEGRHSNVLLKISIPEGSRGTYVGLTDTLHEHEIILVPNTKIRIDSFCLPFQKEYKCTVISH